MRRLMVPVLVLLAFALGVWSQHRATMPVSNAATPTAIHSAKDTPAPSSTHLPAAIPSSNGLPREATETLALIQRGGPFLHRQDGVVFENRERELPAQPHGYYHEYTVETPDAHDRGARRIIAGGDPPSVYYFTDDHYRSFHTLEATR